MAGGVSSRLYSPRAAQVGLKPATRHTKLGAVCFCLGSTRRFAVPDPLDFGPNQKFANEISPDQRGRLLAAQEMVNRLPTALGVLPAPRRS